MSKYLCLSFDDGPNNVAGDNTMSDMLDILEKYKVPASFFIIGSKITEENKKVIRRAFDMGCDIQNHAWTHSFMAQMSPDEIKEEYKKCDDAVFEITGVRPSFFRPPYISVSQTMYYNIDVPFICGCGCNDWEQDKDADYRYEHIMQAAQNGTIFLLHVMEGNKATLEAVDRAIPELLKEGYEFVNLPALFEKCGVEPRKNNALWSVAIADPKSNIWHPWAKQIPQGAFITDSPTYKVGEYFSRFHKDSFTPADFAQMGYYFYDPTEHGYPKGQQYPLLVFMHGTTNALEGDVCINYAGAEFYSKEDYQKTLGGAYLLLPLANEYRDQEGNCRGAWGNTYVPPVYELIKAFIQKHTLANGGVSKKVVFGNSSGGRMALRLSAAYPEFFDVVVPMGAAEIPDESLLDLYDQNNISLFFAMGKRDEFNDYQKQIVPLLPRMKRMKNCFIFTPDWVYNGDHGIASINFGVEMGQHCIINPMHCNLMFDDGSPMEPSLPDGVTGWLAKVIK